MIHDLVADPSSIDQAKHNSQNLRSGGPDRAQLFEFGDNLSEALEAKGSGLEGDEQVRGTHDRAVRDVVEVWARILDDVVHPGAIHDLAHYGSVARRGVLVRTEWNEFAVRGVDVEIVSDLVGPLSSTLKKGGGKGAGQSTSGHKGSREVGLAVGVDRQDPFLLSGQAGRQVEGQRGFAAAAFPVENANVVSHMSCLITMLSYSSKTILPYLLEYVNKVSM